MPTVLEENGESERAEFIRLQVELARGVKKASERQALERRQRGLLAANKSRWVAPLKQALGPGRWRSVGLRPRIRRVFRTARQDGRVARGEVGGPHSRPRVDRDSGNNRPGGRPVQALVAGEPDPPLPAEDPAERCGRQSRCSPVRTSADCVITATAGASVGWDLDDGVHEMGPGDPSAEEMNLLRGRSLVERPGRDHGRDEPGRSLGRMRNDRKDLVPDHRHRLPEQPAAHRHGVREARRRRAGPLPPHGGVRRLLPDGQRREHGQGLEAGRRARARTPQAYCDDMARQFREVWDALDISYDVFIQTSERAAQAVLPEVHPEGVRQRPHLQGRATRAGTATAARSSRARRSTTRTPALCPNHKTPLIAAVGAVLLLQAVGVPGPAAGALRGEPRLHPAGEPAERDRQPHQDRGAAGPQHHAARRGRGASASRSTRSSRSTSGSTPC